MHSSQTGRRSPAALAALTAAVIVLAAGEARAAVSFVGSSQSAGQDISFVGSNLANSGNPTAGSVTLTRPAGTTDGTLLVVQIAIRESDMTPTTITPTAPAAGAEPWTLLRQDVNPATGTHVISSAIFYKFNRASDPGTFTFTFSASRRYAAGILAYDGVHPTSPIDVHAAQLTASSRTTTAPSVTPTFDNERIVWFYSYARGDQGGGTMGAPTAGDVRYQTTTSGGQGGGDLGVQVLGADLQQTTAAATGTQTTFFPTNNERPNIGQTVALRSASAVTIDVPAGTTAGDVMIASISVRPGTISITTPSGWTLIREVAQASGTSSRLVTYFRVAGSAEPANYSWIFTGGTHAGAVGGIASFRDVDTGSPIDAEVGAATPASLDHAAPSVTTTENNGMLVTVHAFGSSATWTSPAGTTEVVDVASLTPPDADGISMAMNYEALPVGGATGTRSASASNDSDTGATQSIALRPGVFTPPLAGALAHYAMDEAFWTGAASEVVDSSANALLGVSRNGANTAGDEPAILGNPGTCRYGVFSGGSFVEGLNAAAINDAIAVSVAAWVRMSPGDQAGAEQTLIAYGGATDTTDGRFHLFRRSSDGQLYFEIRRQASAPISPSVSIPGTAVFDGSWHHVVGSYNQGNRELSLYVDGMLAQTASFTGNPNLNDVSGPLTIGALPDESNGIAGNLDEVHIFNSPLTPAEVSEVFSRTRTCAVFLDHVRIEHDGEGLTCTPEEVTVRACANPDCTESYTLSVTTTLTATQPSSWVGGDTLTFSGGSTTAQLRRTTAGTVTLGAAGTSPTPISATRCFGGTNEPCSLNFVDSGFIFDVPTVTACKTSANATISAVKNNPADATCAPAFSGNRLVNFWSTYVDPSTGTQPVSVDNGTVIAIATTSPGTAVDLNFDANAQVTITVNYPDAGLIRLNVRYEGTGDEADLVMTGNDDFVSVPVGLAAYAASSCTAGDATCSSFGKAGEPFDLNVKAACWDSDTDTDLSDNPSTPNFRMTGIPLDHNLVAPGGGNPGDLGITSLDFTDADNGVRTISQTISEVGVFTFTATPAAGAYFGETVPAGTSPNIGRFTPDHFTLTNGTLVNRIDEACSPVSTFTYMDEMLRLGFSLTAQSASNATTGNYTGAFAKLDLNDINVLNIGAIDTMAPTPLTSRIAAVSSSGSWSNGVADNIFARVGLNRAVTVDGQFQAVKFGIAPVDPDGVALTGFDLDVDNDSTNDRGLVATGDVRYGRLLLQNAFGSELLDLPMPMRAQYYASDTVGFITSTEDTCTAIIEVDLQLSNSSGTVDGSGPITVGGGTTSATITHEPFAGGAAGLLFSAPGEGGDGFVDVTLQPGVLPAYLRYDWTGDGTYDNDPQARVTFGIFKGNRRHIYRRERY